MAFKSIAEGTPAPGIQGLSPYRQLHIGIRDEESADIAPLACSRALLRRIAWPPDFGHVGECCRVAVIIDGLFSKPNGGSLHLESFRALPICQGHRSIA